MALSYFGFSCDPVRGEPHLVLVRIDSIVFMDYWDSARRRFTLRGTRRRHVSLGVSHGLVVPRKSAAAVCLDLLRRGVKPWADPRRRRAA